MEGCLLHNFSPHENENGINFINNLFNHKAHVYTFNEFKAIHNLPVAYNYICICCVKLFQDHTGNKNAKKIQT